MAKEKGVWFDLSPSMFPANVQAAVKKVHEANKVLSAKYKALPEYAAAEKAEAEATALIEPFFPRIQVPVNPAEPNGDKTPLMVSGYTVNVAYRWNKLSCERKAISAKAKQNGVVLT